MQEDGGDILTLAELIEATTETIELPRLSARLKRPVRVTIGVLSQAAYVAMLPPSIPGSEQWTAPERVQRVEAYLLGLSREERAAWGVSWLDVAYRVCAEAIVEPKMGADDARRLGDDAEWLAGRILVFSGIIEEAAPATAGAEALADEVPAEAVTGAAAAG